MVDRVRFLKIETPVTGGTQTDMLPVECDPTQDYGAVKGITFENLSTTYIFGNAGVLTFADSVVTTPATLNDLTNKLKLKTVDLTNLTNGYVLTWNNTLTKFELQPAGGAGGGSGVTPPFFFSKAGSAGAGTYLRVGEAVSSNTGMTIVGANTIVKLVVSNGSAVGSNTVIQIQKRTAVNTFVDIASASITILTGAYSATSSGLSIALGTNEELSAYVKSGSSLDNPVFGVYVVPT